MSSLVSYDTVALDNGEPCFQITMTAPRANALEPDLLAQLHRTFDALEQSGVQKTMICGGRNFSTGGDVGRFFEAAQQGQAESYARQVVPVLQDLVHRMIEMPVLFACALRGAATGGAAGILFASDIAVAAPDAFVQPYYVVMGFAPDGGWASVLPERIGVGPAQGWLLANQRHEATDLQRIGLVQAVDETPETKLLTMFAEMETDSTLATKSILWNENSRARIREGLDAETSAFLSLIERQETLSRMEQFLKQSG